MDFISQFINIALNRLLSGDTTAKTDMSSANRGAALEQVKDNAIVKPKTSSTYQWLGNIMK